MQQIWLQLLDTDFMEAYEHGIVLECGDGVLRRLFPRLLTYSADYPEKYVPRMTCCLYSTDSSFPECYSPPSRTSANARVHAVL